MFALGATAKILAISAALQVATLGAWAWNASSLRGERDKALTDMGFAAAGRQTCMDASAATVATLEKSEKEHATCVAQWAKAQTDIAAANAVAETARTAAADALRAFRGRFESRGETCGAALAALDTACSELEGY
jgi:hypothetical protein